MVESSGRRGEYKSLPSLKGPSATIRDVAQKAGVSVATVSRVLNNIEKVSPGTIERVQTAIEELNFVPHAAAQNLSNRRTNVIGLLLTDITWENFFPPMLRGIENGCFDGGFELLIHSTRLVKPGFRRPVGEQNTDGLIIFTNALPDPEIVRLYTKNFPIVLLHRSPPNQLEIPHVVFENKNGSRKMTDHLIEDHGYRKIAFLAGPDDNEDAAWRTLGYRESLAAHGIPLNDRIIRLGGFDEKTAMQTMEKWLEDGFDADVVFAADDDSAYGAMNAVQKAGKRIPEDIPIVGFDDAPISRMLTPSLSTVSAPIEAAGYMAAQLLCQKIRTGSAEYKTLLPTELILRRSCGCGE
jgi:DNA-binding LacI/PurR family transcriptional regulator